MNTPEKIAVAAFAVIGAWFVLSIVTAVVVLAFRRAGWRTR